MVRTVSPELVQRLISHAERVASCHGHQMEIGAESPDGAAIRICKNCGLIRPLLRAHLIARLARADTGFDFVPEMSDALSEWLHRR
jgi:hypothetical protein